MIAKDKKERFPAEKATSFLKEGNEGYITAPRDSKTPDEADFSVYISDECMLPLLPPGERVFVSINDKVENGDIGIFFVDGEIKCRQYCEDSAGNIYLFVLKREKSEADVFIPSSSRKVVFSLGKVIIREKIPLPEKL